MMVIVWVCIVRLKLKISNFASIGQSCELHFLIGNGLYALEKRRFFRCAGIIRGCWGSGLDAKKRQSAGHQPSPTVALALYLCKLGRFGVVLASTAGAGTPGTHGAPQWLCLALGGAGWTLYY